MTSDRIERWTPYARAVFRGRFGRRADDDDAQELRLIIWHALRDHVPARGPWLPFLAFRVKSRTIDRLRARDGRRGERWAVNHPVSTTRDPGLPEWEPAPTPDRTEDVALADLMARLPSRQREALTEYADGRPTSELARLWGVSERIVWQARTRGAARMAAWIKGAG